VVVKIAPIITVVVLALISTSLAASEPSVSSSVRGAPISGAATRERSGAGPQRVWFAPLPPMPTRPGREYIGSSDFMKLFSPKAPWKTASKRVGVFKLYGEWIQGTATDAQLGRVVRDLRRRHIALAVEAGPLQASSECGEGVEGFGGLTSGRLIADRIKAVHGTLAFIALDEPFYYANVYDGPNACHWPPKQIAGEVREFIAAVRAVFPRVVVGDIEPLDVIVQVRQLVQWLDAYHAVSGEQLPFFHLDVGFLALQDWPQATKELEDAARARGIAFGLIYDGDGGTDQQWTQAAEQRFTTYEAQYGGRPDNAIFQSWVDHPDYVLPETKPGTFSYLIDRYFRRRTSLRLDLSPPASDGSRSAGGTLADDRGHPLSGAPVELSATPLDGPGTFAEYSLFGTVPTEATTAVVGLRINTECGCSAASEFRLYGARYTEPSRENAVPNPSFDQGWAGWGAWGDGSVALEPSDRAGAWMLHVRASPGQIAAINSSTFRVSSGAAFTLSFAARVAPRSRGSGYFAIFFLSPATEVARRTIALAPSTVALGTTTTGADGSFTAAVRGLPEGTSLVEAWYRGDGRYFPAYASGQPSADCLEAERGDRGDEFFVADASEAGGMGGAGRHPQAAAVTGAPAHCGRSWPAKSSGGW
jgi:hypothetical protein